MGTLGWLAIIMGTLMAAEVLARLWHDPRARDRTGDGALLPAATRRLSPRQVRRATRIVVLGDSIPFGWPLANHDGYPARLEALLQASSPGRAIAVINAAIGGNTAVLGLARVERDLVRWQPHIALIAFGLNDCHLARTGLDEQRERAMAARQRPVARLRALLRRSALLDVLLEARRRRNNRTGSVEKGNLPPHPAPLPLEGRGNREFGDTRHDSSLSPREGEGQGEGGGHPSLLEQHPNRHGFPNSTHVSLSQLVEGQEPVLSAAKGEGGRYLSQPQPRTTPQAYSAALRALVRAARNCHARPYLLTMSPLGPAALAGEWDRATYQRYDILLRQVAAEEHVPIVDIGTAFPTGAALAPLLAADGLHLTAAGQEVVAQAIARLLKEGE